MTLRLNGATSGSVSLDAPATGSNVTLELPTDSIKPGLVLVAAQSFTGVSSVSVNNCFTATYDNYRVICCGSSSAGNLLLRYRVSGTDTSSSYQRAGFFADSGPGSGTFLVGTGQSDIVLSDKSNWTVSSDIYRPRLAAHTHLTSVTSQNTSIPAIVVIGAQQTSSTQFDGFSLISSSGTITGTVFVYGYRNSL